MKFIAWLIRRILSLRYAIEVKGIEHVEPLLRSKGKEGILFLPNHPAALDPVVLLALLSSKTRVSPLVTERFFESAWISFFLNLVRALPLPSMDQIVNQWKSKEIHKMYEQIRERLKEGGNFLIYPAGRLKSSGSEAIGGASLVFDLVSEVPGCRAVLVRTTGFWGSMFSRYLTGESPPFSQRIVEGIKILLKNGIFFTPRRKLLIEFEVADKTLLGMKDKLAFNRALEEWYNAKGEEKPSFASYSLFKEKYLQLEQKKKKEYFSPSQKVPENVKEEVVSFLAPLAKKPKEKIDAKQKLFSELGLDSLDMAEIHAFLQARFDTPQLPAACLQTVDDVFKAASGFFTGELEEESVVRRVPLSQESNRSAPFFPEGKTLQEVFISNCKANAESVACVDAITAPLTYKRLLIAALALASHFKKTIPETHVGILLPSTCGAYLTILATLLAGKIPVMLNWTAGVRSLDHAIDTCGIKTVISSRRFLERLDQAEFGKVQELLIYLEYIKKEIGLKEKLKALFLSWKNKERLMSHLKLSQSEEDVAVILFTSGTESLPKAVPLTHNNLLSDQRAALSCVDFGAQDKFYCVLPPFHSFGFSVTGLLPLLINLLAIYSPDPTNGRKMADEVGFWKPTIFCSAPSFLKGLLFSAKPGQLDSLRLLVAGAEKAPAELYAYVKEHLNKAKLIEGYGITECSPIVTLVRPDQPSAGVGLPLPHVAVAILDPETETFLGEGQEGEVVISGPNVFNGYLGIKKDPFFYNEGKRWYRSGDRGKLDQEGSLLLSGRYKRFMKIGAEMVSLGGLEDDVVTLLQAQGMLQASDTPQVAIGVKKEDGEKSAIILFAKKPVDVDKVNLLLREKGYARIVKISACKQVSEIPLLGTGKINYRALEENL